MEVWDWLQPALFYVARLTVFNTSDNLPVFDQDDVRGINEGDQEAVLRVLAD